MGISTAEFDYVCHLTKRHSAIVLESEKKYLVDMRLDMLANHEGYVSGQALIQHLWTTSEPRLLKKVIDAMTINETYFFRDLHPFELLRELIPARQATGQPLNIWSAACSTGQEPYSIAMMLQMYFPELLLKGQTRLIASDLSQTSLDYARKGIYNQFQVNRGLPVNHLVRYFDQRGSQWHLRAEIRDQVSFHEINLIEAWPELPKMDFIFLRNVLIYFDIESRRRILDKIRGLLKPGGYLFLGTAEMTATITPGFERVDARSPVNYYRIKH